MVVRSVLLLPVTMWFGSTSSDETMPAGRIGYLTRVDDCGRDGVGLLISLLLGKLPVGFVFPKYCSARGF